MFYFERNIQYFQGDSGGPLVHRNSETEQFTLIGVVAGYLMFPQCDVKYEVSVKIRGIPGKRTWSWIQI